MSFMIFYVPNGLIIVLEAVCKVLESLEVKRSKRQEASEIELVKRT